MFHSPPKSVMPLSAYDLIYRAVYGLMCRGCGVL